MQKAFSSPLELPQRLGTLDAAEIAAMRPGAARGGLPREARAPPLPRRNMARRVQELCAAIASEYDGDAPRVWTKAPRRRRPRRSACCALPGLRRDEGRARSVAVLAKRLGVRPPAGSEFAPHRTASATSTRPRRSRSTRRRSAPTRPRRERRSRRPPEPMPIELRTLTDGGQTRGRDRPRARRVPRRRAHEPRHRALRRALRDRRRRARPRDAARRAPARRRDPARLQRRPPRPDPRAAAARDEARGDRGPARADARDRRHPRPDAPQVRRPRRHATSGRARRTGRTTRGPGRRT